MGLPLNRVTIFGVERYAGDGQPGCLKFLLLKDFQHLWSKTERPYSQDIRTYPYVTTSNPALSKSIFPTYLYILQ
jgi:hypothetical protein